MGVQGRDGSRVGRLAVGRAAHAHLDRAEVVRGPRHFGSFRRGLVGNRQRLAQHRDGRLKVAGIALDFGQADQRVGDVEALRNRLALHGECLLILVTGLAGVSLRLFDVTEALVAGGDSPNGCRVPEARVGIPESPVRPTPAPR